MSLTISLLPSARLLLEDRSESVQGAGGNDSFSDATVISLLTDAFGRSTADGLLLLPESRITGTLPPEFLFWREWSRRFLKAVSQLGDDELTLLEKLRRPEKKSSDAVEAPVASVPVPNDLVLAVIVAEAPPMRGLEYLTPTSLRHLWAELTDRFRERAIETKGGVRALLRLISPESHLLGRVTFHLAENKRDPARPFAFLATYANRMSAKSQVQHLPLAEALRQYAAERDQTKLAELLAPVRDAAERSIVARALLESRALFQPQAWTISQAHRFLSDVATLESAGVIVRVPDWWKGRKTARPQVQVRIGQAPKNAIGLDALLDFSTNVVLNGEVLTDEERASILAATDGLIMLRGKWVEVDPKKLSEALDHWQELEEQYARGITFLEGMRLLAGTQLQSDVTVDDSIRDWTSVASGDWLSETLQNIRDPRGIIGCEPGIGLNASLRPYQADGVRWLWFMTSLGLGACLADDMGLGKTIQVIDLILRLKQASSPPATASGTRNRKAAAAESSNAKSLLIVPASLVGNWKEELQRFAPQLNVLSAHRSECDAAFLDRLAANPQKELEPFDVVVTTYTLIRRAEWPAAVRWQLVVLDEAQAIKNPGAAQSRSVRKLDAAGKVILTGTPVENQLGDLWSLFDFCCPGLLGNVTQFRKFLKQTEKSQSSGSYGPLRKLVQPYILRRMKTDPNIVPDLPDKTELQVPCGLSKRQAVLYQQIINDVEEQLEKAEGIQRRGLVLGMMMRLKQLCNHPAQLLNQPEFPPAESGKFLQLAEVCQPISDRQEKVLVFTQFQSLCDPLAEFLTGLFGREGLVLHGGVAVAKRKVLVRRFQEDDSIPFFVISVKAGGTGLNLTAASHVIHFDRWWNPAVENQATDRAFRIGQKRNVLVHKFVCRGTLEERIDKMIRDKQGLADEILGQGAESKLTEMSNDELLKFVSLDISRAAIDD